MDNSATDKTIDIPFSFRLRPRPLPADLRPAFRLAVLVLIIEHCRGGRASVEQLHVMDWSIRTPHTRSLFLEYMEGKRKPSEVIVRMDPSLSRAIDFALAEKLVTHREPNLLPDIVSPMTSLRFMLTKDGRELAKELMAMEGCLEDEKYFLASIGSKVTQSQVHGLFDWNR